MAWLWLFLTIIAANLVGVVLCWILKGSKALSFVLAFCIFGFMWLVTWLLPYTDTFH
ncbi:hypothetical protein GTB64_004543 [Salmonella enterica]|nr:hypothetical protein [Salmonella enterica]